MRGLVIVSRDDQGVAHDGSAGVSPEGWLPDRVSVGALTRAFPPEVVDRVVATTDTREIRRRLLPARLVVYFVLALWLFRGPNCGYGRVMVKLVEALYHRRRGQQLLDGVLDPEGWVDAGEGRRWRPPNISSLARARTRLGADPLHMLFEQVAGPVGAPDAAGVFCCGLRVVSMDGSSTDVPDTKENDEYFGRPSNATRDGAFPQVRWVVAAEYAGSPGGAPQQRPFGRCDEIGSVASYASTCRSRDVTEFPAPRGGWGTCDQRTGGRGGPCYPTAGNAFTCVG